MRERNFMKMIRARWPKTLLCIGLDADPKKISAEVRDELLLRSWAIDDSDPEIVLGFNKAIISATRDLVCAYKPNIAFYERLQERLPDRTLIQTIAFIMLVNPRIPIILDAKRGDIGNTNFCYIEAAFNKYCADAVTVHNYIGQEDGMQPFLDRADKGIIVLCRTSNKGAKEFQDLLTLPPDFFDDETIWMTNLAWVRDRAMPLYQRVARNVSKNWNTNGNCALVVGATHPKELKEVRAIVGDDMPILNPGIGAQGGDLEAAVKNGINSRGDGIIISVSRSILYKSTGHDFATAARREAKRIRDEINKYRRG